MAENPFAVRYPNQADNMAGPAELLAKQQEEAYQNQQRAKNAPMEDLARQVKMQQLKQELDASPNIAKLLQQQGPAPTPQGPATQTGQQPTVDPEQQYQATVQRMNNIWKQATDPNSPLLKNPAALEGLSKMLAQGFEFAQKARGNSLSKNIGRDPEPVGIVNGKYVPLSQAPEGTKEAGTLEYDDKGQPKVTAMIKQGGEAEKSLPKLEYEGWLVDHPTTKDPKTGKVRPSNANDYKMSEDKRIADLKATEKREEETRKKKEAEAEMAPVVDQAVMNEEFNQAKLLAYKDKSTFTKMLAKEYKNIDPVKLMANANLTGDTRTLIRKNMAVGLKGRLDNLLTKLQTMKPGKFKTANDFTNWVKNQANDPEMADLLSSKNSILFELGQALGAGSAPSDYKTRIDDITLNLGNNVGSMEKTISNFKGALDVVTKLQKQQDPRTNKKKDSKGRPITAESVSGLLDWELENYLHGE